jgi:large repetitive protein
MKRAFFIAGTGSTPPGTPTSVSATDQGVSRPFNNGQASVSFTPPTTGIRLPATSFTVTPSPSTSPATFTSSGSPVTVTGLQSTTAYTYTVTASNSVGTSPASAASSAVRASTISNVVTINSVAPSSASAVINFTPINYITNPSFEEGTVTGFAGANSAPTASTLFAKTGTYSASVALANTTDSNFLYWNGNSVPGAGRYFVSAWFYIPTGSTLNGAQVSIGPEGGTGYTTIEQTLATLTIGQWTKATVVIDWSSSFVIPPIVARVNVNPSLYQGQLIYSDDWGIATSNGGLEAVTSYLATATPGNIQRYFRNLPTTGNQSTGTFTGLTNGTAYQITLQAFNANGFSNLSSAFPVTPVAPPVPVAPTVTPTAPTAPTVTPTAPTAPTVTPTAPTAPTVTPTAPTVTPTAPTVTPTAPTVTPTAPTVTPTAPSSCVPNQGEFCEVTYSCAACSCCPYPCYRPGRISCTGVCTLTGGFYC